MAFNRILFLEFAIRTFTEELRFREAKLFGWIAPDAHCLRVQFDNDCIIVSRNGPPGTIEEERLNEFICLSIQPGAPLKWMECEAHQWNDQVPRHWFDNGHQEAEWRIWLETVRPHFETMRAHILQA